MILESNLIGRSTKNQYKIKKVSNNVMYKFITDLVDFLEFYNRDKFSDCINDLGEYQA